MLPTVRSIVVLAGDQLPPSYEQDLDPRLIPGILIRPDILSGALRQKRKDGKIVALSEFPPQYGGLEPASPKLEEYWALAEELDIPVGIHM